MDKTPGTWTYFTKPHYVDGRCWRSIQMDDLISNFKCLFIKTYRGYPPYLIYVVLKNFLCD